MTTRAGAAARSTLIAASLIVQCLSACHGGESPPAGAASPPAGLAASEPAVVAESFLEASRRLNDGLGASELEPLVSAMERAMSANPRAHIATLESSIGGDSAVRRYAKSMLETGRGEPLGRQLAVILRGGDPRADVRSALSMSSARDGSVWFDNAEDAGFFAGAVAWALEQQADPASAAASLAAGLGAEIPRRTPVSGGWRTWLRDVVFPPDAGERARPGVPAEHAFDQAFRRVVGVND
jgi:hypothetical protein